MAQFLNRLFILLVDYTTFNAVGNTQEYARRSVEVSHLVFKVDFLLADLKQHLI